MFKKIIKYIEIKSKRILETIIIKFLPKPKRSKIPLNEINKVLVFRLDERIGNGVMLLPLITAIRNSINTVELHVLIHQPVAELFTDTTNGLISKIWIYNQPYLIKRPWKMIHLFTKLKREKFDVIITSHNPDNFSFSQALLGRWCKGKRFVGFNWKNSSLFYDIAVTADLNKHYSDSMVDLWHIFDKSAIHKDFKLEISQHLKQSVKMKYPEADTGGVLLWLGAGKGGRKAIPNNLVFYILKFIQEQTKIPVMIATGPSDIETLNNYSKDIKDRTILWSGNLLDTAVFFSFFQVFISGDTGPLHIAVALNLHSLGIFFHTDIKRYGYNDGERHFSILFDKEKDDYKTLDEYLVKILKIKNQ